MVEIRLLGPVEALREGVRAPLGPKPLALLVVLALAEGRVVAVDRIVDELWEGRPPETVQKVVQVYVSQLRKTLGSELVETREPGYRLPRGVAAVDLARFEELTGSARSLDPRARAARLREALALWRGEALAGVREPFAAAAGARLEELRLAALDDRIAAELELGAGSELVPELEALVEAEPLRERPRAQLMLALYRAGRQVDALARYRDGRRLLVEELGLEPGPALQELERAILRQDPALVPLVTPPRRTVLVLEPALLALARPLRSADHELLAARLVASTAGLAVATEELAPIAAEGIRVAAFTSADPAGDTIRLAREQDAALALACWVELDAVHALDALPCDLALATAAAYGAISSIAVPFGGGEHEWAALELGVWLARAHGVPLRLVGSAARDDRRDASRLLASASLVVQRFAGIVPEPALGDPSELSAETLLVVGLPDDWRENGLGRAREALLERPCLLVRRGVRPGGLAPADSLTRFTWSLG